MKIVSNLVLKTKDMWKWFLGILLLYVYLAIQYVISLLWYTLYMNQIFESDWYYSLFLLVFTAAMVTLLICELSEVFCREFLSLETFSVVFLNFPRNYLHTMWKRLWWSYFEILCECTSLLFFKTGNFLLSCLFLSLKSFHFCTYCKKVVYFVTFWPVACDVISCNI